ncbi:dTDP-4-dehydrorhamnose 3,5-epimerase [Sphingosinicella sp. CPCC 101087]|uniref:dTDP-4-dehydrorhamnose 3,5-epimerase n=1 Tax=Sphingosinicella sp. CPCC 101087 TaxID=2497754 RepID=UPI00101CFF6C|nr:dTDP-4-dehydrorhamnose 3,5-epimerase [Sphingosinicella sp. CPCC 101087]
MKLVDTRLPEVKIVEPRIFGDERGFFFESWNARDYAGAGLEQTFVQDNHSRSARGVLRGLHYQLEKPQGKLVRVISGRAFDVAVDIRRSSPRFGQWAGVELSAENKRLLWIPPGFAHGFLSLEDGTDFVYKCTDYYAPDDERAILWRDARIAIDWPLGALGQPLVSAKDARGSSLTEADVYP